MGLCCECEMRSLPWQSTVCLKCAQAVPLPDSVCGKCLKNNAAYDQIIAPFRYESSIKYLIKQFKFHEQLQYGYVLADLLGKSLINHPHFQKPEILLPVPLHYQRLKKRGFNQAAEIAKRLAVKLNITLHKNLLKKTIPTLPQSEQNFSERKKNIRHAFSWEKNFLFDHVAIVDDIVTTGSTVNEIALLLKQQGIKKVSVFAVARA